MKKNILLLLLLMIIVSISACKKNSVLQDKSQNKMETSNKIELTKEKKIAWIYTDLSAGSAEVSAEKHEFLYDGDLAPKLLEALSGITGLDFIAEIKQTDNGIIVDWNKESTLVANLDDREQKEDFHFFDSDSMRWFMMDSLYRTLKENYGEQDIYYTMDGGKKLEFEELYPTKYFPSDITYMGSPFYFAHADSLGNTP